MKWKKLALLTFLYIGFFEFSFANSTNLLIELNEALTIGDGELIHKKFNEIKREKRGDTFLSEMREVYEGAENLVGANNLALVKINAGDIIVQAWRNGYLPEGDLMEVHDFAKAQVWSQKALVAVTAINVVSMFDTEEDFELLLEVAEEQNPRTFRASILGLVSMCDSFSDTKFSNLLNKLNDNEHRIAIEIKDKFKEFSKVTGWCKELKEISMGSDETVKKPGESMGSDSIDYLQ